MTSTILKCGEYSTAIRHECEYSYLGGIIKGADLLKMKFNHLTDWLDQKILIHRLEHFQEMPIEFEPSIHKSLNEQEEDSPYWGIDNFDKLKLFKRLQRKESTEYAYRAKLKKPVDLKLPSSRVKLTRLRKGLAKELSISQDAAGHYVNKYITHENSYRLNKRNPETVKLIIEHFKL